MSAFLRIEHFLTGILMVLTSLMILLFPEDGHHILIVCVSITLVAVGLRSLVFYVTMARHMVGGRAILYFGIFLFDLGIFTCTLYDIPQAMIMLYLSAIHAFSGIMNILRSRESHRMHASNWQLSLVSGISSIAIACICAIFIGSVKTALLIYGFGLAYTGIVRIISAFQRTRTVFIS
jgi:uncharacterized membrane protein HdeD (DUF308 family)